MPSSPTRSSHRRALALAVPLFLLASLLPLATVSAAVGVTPATGGGSISADTNSTGGTGAYTTLSGPSLQEGSAGELASGSSIVLTAPAGFAFNPGSASATAGGTGCAGLALGTVTTTATTVTIPITAVSTAPCTVSVTGLQARPTAGSPLASGNITNTGTTGPTGSNYGTLTEVAGAPVITVTSGSITNTTGNSNLSPSPAFHVADAWGNVRAGDNVTLAIKSGTGTTGALLTCTTNPVTTGVGGNAAYSGCSIDQAGIGYVLRATTGSAAVETNAFNISVGAPDKLVFKTYPTPTTASLFTPQPSVAVTDAGGNVITTDNSTVVTLAISPNPGTFTCTGGLSRTVTAGVATFAGCTQTSTGTYTLTATSSPALTLATSPSFTVSSAAASMLAFCWGTALACPTAPPATVNGGVEFTTQPTIRVEDAAGNTVTSDNSTVVTLALAPGTPTSGGPGTLTCTGGLTRTVTAGVATFSGCSVDKSGVGYRIVATSSPALTAATSSAFNAAAGTATTLVFVTQPPATATSGGAFPGTIQVGIADAGGNVVTTGVVATVSLTLGTTPATGTLACTGGTTATTVNGIATFTGCSITGTGTGFTLVATATSTTPTTTLAPATSTAINLTSAAAATISITTSPSLNSASPKTAVIVWGHGVTLTVHLGATGASAANRSVRLEVTKDLATWSTISTLTTNAAGEASFSYRPSDNRYYRAVFAGAADLGQATSASVRVVVRSIVLLRPTNLGKVRTVNDGTTVTFTATARPNRPELPQPIANFVVYQLQGRTWVKVLDKVVPANREDGVATLAVTFATRGEFYVRTQLVPTPVNANSGWTPVQRYSVR